jgi:thioredoxin-related protein
MNNQRFLGVMLTAMLSIVSSTIVSSTKAEDVWAEDASRGIEQAVKEDKDLLLLFTGSDWCPPCQKLEQEVLSNEEFQFEATKHFVLVKFDFLKQTPQERSVTEQNEEWSEKFGVDDFPTVFLVDHALKPYAIAGYEDGGFQNYLGMLEESRQVRINRDEKLKAAAKQEGLERARLLDEAISEMHEEITSIYYPEIIEEIVALDKDDELGLRSKWNSAKEAEMRKIIMTDVMMISRLEKPDRAIKFIDDVLDEIEFPASEKLEILQMKLNLIRQLNDNEKTDQLLDEMINLDGVTDETRQRLIVKKIYLMIGSDREAEALKLLENSLTNGDDNRFLLLAKGEYLDSKGEFDAAIEAYDGAIELARNGPDLLIDLVSAKADALYELKREAEALQTLDNFADDTQMPSDLRAEALLHKSMMMRDMKRIRQARLAENRAIEITESAGQRAEMQKIVDRLREKYED